jgi:hypothetical protein
LAKVLVETAIAINLQTLSAQSPTPGNIPSDTPLPTNTSLPINTPLPPSPMPEPISVSGSGDMIVNAENPYNVAIVHILGNSCGRFFAVTNYDSSGQQIDLLVNTTDPYDGIRPIDFRQNEHTTRFEINASCEWQINILPLLSVRSVTVPGTISGSGDDVIALVGGTPDLASIRGNSGSRFFAVTGYGNSLDLLVNTTDPYEGTVIVSSDTIILEIQGVGEWSIEITSK